MHPPTAGPMDLTPSITRCRLRAERNRRLDDDGEAPAAEVDEPLLARPVDLPHRDRKVRRPGRVPRAELELAVLVPVGLRLAVLLPEELLGSRAGGAAPDGSPPSRGAGLSIRRALHHGGVQPHVWKVPKSWKPQTLPGKHAPTLWQSGGKSGAPTHGWPCGTQTHNVKSPCAVIVFVGTQSSPPGHTPPQVGYGDWTQGVAPIG